MNDLLNDRDREGLVAERDSILNAARTVIIAAGTGDVPEIGVTPMVRHQGQVFIYPSRLSAHVRGMLEAEKAQFMFVQDEADAQNIWARKRIKICANIIEIERNSNEFNEVASIFTEAHGPTMKLIRDFSDFHMLKLLPENGVMVLGFAKAYRLEGTSLDIVSHLRES